MRNLFLMLLAANILFFGWRHWVFEADPNVIVVDKADLGEQIPLATEVPQEAPQTEPAAIDTEQSTPAKTLPATVGRACVTVGPFTDVDIANAELKDLTNAGMQVADRAAQGDVFIGHWVYVGNIPSRTQARALVSKLKAGGIKDATLYAGATGEDVISLGIFSSLSGAERIELQAKSIGIEASMDDRYRQATVFWLDIKLQPGQSGERLVDSYGSDKVLLGERATCPAR